MYPGDWKIIFLLIWGKANQGGKSAIEERGGGTGEGGPSPKKEENKKFMLHYNQL